MNVGDMKAALAKYDDELDVFFRCIAPFIGTVREVDRVEESTYSIFGVEIPCVLLDVERED